jgi:agmatine deiminase
LLNDNRNAWTEAEAEAALSEAFGASKIIWLDQGLLNDHTEGHIDAIARFVAPSRVVCQSPAGTDDPNAETLKEIARVLEAATDALGRKLEVIRIPSPGLVVNDLGEAAPASHVNFVIANGVVAVPIYGTPSATRAVEALQDVFPHRKVVGLPSRTLLGSGTAGGGSFHCITREEPA